MPRCARTRAGTRGLGWPSGVSSACASMTQPWIPPIGGHACGVWRSGRVVLRPLVAHSRVSVQVQVQVQVEHGPQARAASLGHPHGAGIGPVQDPTLLQHARAQRRAQGSTQVWS
jgi:hypothetical protein